MFLGPIRATGAKVVPAAFFMTRDLRAPPVVPLGGQSAKAVMPDARLRGRALQPGSGSASRATRSAHNGG